jgi:two-component system, NtrC family, response regulator HydG
MNLHMKKKEGTILVIDDNRDVLQAIRFLLEPEYSKVITLLHPENIFEVLQEHPADTVLLDMNFRKDMSSGKEGLYWLEKILETAPQTNVIMITAYGDVDIAVKALKGGAIDFVVKPWRNEKLLATVAASVNLSSSRKEVSKLKEREQELLNSSIPSGQDMVGNSPPMRNMYRMIEKVAKTDANVLILGENGSGKELVAGALHRQSNRKEMPFISVDVGALSQTLFESELFGHVKGAFTDARESRPGRFELASGGTLFLDEIGNLDMPLQAKLLSAIQQKQITRVGANEPVYVDVRLITATNMALHTMIREGRFRRDLLYRINAVEIHVPPLRERGEDIMLLANHFMNLFSKKYRKPVSGIDSEARKKLMAYHWPGNVRELRHIVERGVILSDNPILMPADLNVDKTPAMEDNDHNLSPTLNLEEVEKAAILKAITKYHGNLTRAAKELGLSRGSLYRRMEKYEI